VREEKNVRTFTVSFGAPAADHIRAARIVSNPHRIDIFIGIQNTLYTAPVLKGEKFTCEIFSSYL
jgi:hypothetical protein